MAEDVVWRINENIVEVGEGLVENGFKEVCLVHMHTILLSLFGKQPTFSSLPSSVTFLFAFRKVEWEFKMKR